MKKIILLTLAYSLITLWTSAQDHLPERYEPYIVDVVYASDDIARLKNSSQSEFAYQMSVLDTVPQLLVVQYSGEDKPEKGKKFLFNISVNGTLLYTEGLNRNRHGLFDVVYPIPDSVLQGKSSALVRFEAYDETASVGKIYDVSIVRQKLETGIFTNRKNWQGLA